MSVDPNLPESVSVILPKGVRTIGGLSSTYECFYWLNVRASALDKELIAKAAALCDTTPSMFVRWIATSAARQVIRLSEEREHERRRGRAASSANNNS